jgi:hypothetical protein
MSFPETTGAAPHGGGTLGLGKRLMDHAEIRPLTDGLGITTAIRPFFYLAELDTKAPK